MTHVITQACCNDGACIDVCPVQCIRPRPGDPQFIGAEQLYIDASLCIDCGACFDVCPVNAIEVDYYLKHEHRPYLQINNEYFERHPIEDVSPLPEPVRSLPRDAGSLHVAIIGAGPSGCYAAACLVGVDGVRISMFDRLPTPHGLARAGVAPDHLKTRSIGKTFDAVMARPEVRCFFNVEVGREISLDEVLQHHHAVIWCAGATSDRKLGIPGENLPGCEAAREFVAWYNGHPDFRDRRFDLSGRSVVIIGNGNVALDVARLLVLPPEALNATDMADHAVEALRKSGVREVTLAARRGPAEAAYTLSELLALTYLKDISLVAHPEDLTGRPPASDRNGLGFQILDRVAETRPLEDRRIDLRFLLSPMAINGDGRVESVTFMRNTIVRDGLGTRVEPTGETVTIETSLVLRAIGYRGLPVPGLPFDDRAGVIPNVTGRVIQQETGAPVSGYYCAGWIKRGATGTLGTNKRCSAETVDTLLADFAGGLLPSPPRTLENLSELVASRAPKALDFEAWSRIDAAELREGKRQGRMRRKFVAVDKMLDAAFAEP